MFWFVFRDSAVWLRSWVKMDAMMMIANCDSNIGVGSRTIAARVESMTFDPCNADTAKHGLKLSVPDSDLHHGSSGNLAGVASS